MVLASGLTISEPAAAAMRTRAAQKQSESEAGAITSDAEPPVRLTAREKDERAAFLHRGFAFEAQVGTMGCTRSICGGANGLAADPGVRVEGFLGGNIAGFVDLGIRGGWGTMTPSMRGEHDVLSIYGLDAAALQTALVALGQGDADDPALGGLTIADARVQAAQAGPALRFHFVPRGRISAFVGSGAGYALLRGIYRTPSGEARVDTHGIDIPIEAGLGAHVHRNISVGAAFSYRYTHWLLMQLRHPDHQLIAPISTIDARPELGSPDLQGNLPHFWVVTVGLRARV